MVRAKDACHPRLEMTCAEVPATFSRTSKPATSGGETTRPRVTPAPCSPTTRAARLPRDPAHTEQRPAAHPRPQPAALPDCLQNRSPLHRVSRAPRRRALSTRSDRGNVAVRQVDNRLRSVAGLPRLHPGDLVRGTVGHLLVRLPGRGVLRRIGRVRDNREPGVGAAAVIVGPVQLLSGTAVAGRVGTRPILSRGSCPSASNRPSAQGR